MTTPRKDHLKYLQYLTDHQYDYSDEPEPETPDDSWIWADPPAKDKMKNIIFNGMVDATNLRKEQIKAALKAAKNIQVGTFTLRIQDFYGKDPLSKGTLSIDVFEKRYKTPTGQPCNMDYRADLSKDNRFTNQPWMTYFNGSYGRDIPIETVIEIIRWMQALKRLKAFL